MATKSDNLVWGIIKKNNSFLIKRKENGGLQLSTERFNLTNKNTFQASGFRSRAVDVSVTKKGSVKVGKKSQKVESNKIKKSVTGTILKKKRSGFSKRATSVFKQTGNYRPELAYASAKRYRALFNEQRNKSQSTSAAAKADVIKTA